MSTLMPQGSYRWCGTPTCAHRWYVATPDECACPRCGATVPDATSGWPHVCTRGHGAHHGGACMECVAELEAKLAKRNGAQP